ncbi:pimeloyl-ACP methyl ester carboxylesterase [Streptacidiphilus sp. MAP12-16]|uniref:esterase/lipase family protein n=1 Tax=Streptacidiphilus sp. MAP12-16 TaxID=3156300 RepID=UPI003518724B
MVSIPYCRTATTVRAVGLEAAALAGHLLLYPTGLSSERWPLPRPDCTHDTTPPSPPSSAPAGHAPVLLLHGLFDNRAVFTRMRRSLRSHGWEHVHALNYSPLAVDVRNAALLLGKHVEHTRGVYGGERVAVVGHSLGGLIARYYVQRLGGDEHVHTVITLGTPHQGTISAGLIYPLPIARQLLPSSSVFRELQAPAAPCATRFVVFRGDHDALVLPHPNAALRHPDLWTENILVRGAGHVTLPVHSTVITQVREVLAVPTRPVVLPAPRLSA